MQRTDLKSTEKRSTPYWRLFSPTSHLIRYFLCGIHHTSRRLSGNLWWMLGRRQSEVPLDGFWCRSMGCSGRRWMIWLGRILASVPAKIYKKPYRKWKKRCIYMQRPSWLPVKSSKGHFILNAIALCLWQILWSFRKWIWMMSVCREGKRGEWRTHLSWRYYLFPSSSLQRKFSYVVNAQPCFSHKQDGR